MQLGATEIYNHLKTISSRFGKHFENIISLRKKLEEAMSVVDNFGTDARSITRTLESIKDPEQLEETNLNVKVTNNKGKEVDIGSICSGGAYAKLISRFRGVDIPGTGISFGVDRLLFALMQLDQIKVEDQKPVLVCVMDQKYLKNYYELVDHQNEIKD